MASSDFGISRGGSVSPEAIASVPPFGDIVDFSDPRFNPNQPEFFSDPPDSGEVPQFDSDPQVFVPGIGFLVD